MDDETLDMLIAFSILGTLCLFTAVLVWKFVKSSFSAGVAVAIVNIVLLFWISGAVGIIGSEDNPANLMYGIVFGIVVIGTLIAWGRAQWLKWVMGLAGVSQAGICMIALIGEMGVDGASWPYDVIVLTAFFTSVWFVSAFLFSRSIQLAQP